MTVKNKIDDIFFDSDISIENITGIFNNLDQIEQNAIIKKTVLLNIKDSKFLFNLYNNNKNERFKELLFFYLCLAAEDQEQQEIISFVNQVTKTKQFQNLSFRSFIDFYNYNSEVANSMDDIYDNKFFWESLLVNNNFKNLIEGKEKIDYSVTLDENHFWYNQNCCADVTNIVNDYFFPPITNKLFSLYRLFKKYDFDFNAVNENGDNPLMVALQILKYLNESHDLLTLLQIAELIKVGAKIDLKNNNEESFIDLWLNDRQIQEIKKEAINRPSKWIHKIEKNDFMTDTKVAVQFINSYVENYLIEQGLNKNNKTNSNKI